MNKDACISISLEIVGHISLQVINKGIITSVKSFPALWLLQVLIPELQEFQQVKK